MIRTSASIFVVFLGLGLSSFGGPVAHLGYFRKAFVERRRWLSDGQYSDLLALCQFLPGPASSQVGLSIGLLKGGYGGAFAAWLGFTLPSALLLTLLAIGINDGLPAEAAGVVAGLKVVAVAIVAQAVLGMGRNLCPDPFRQALMVFAACFCLLWPGLISVIVLLIVGALSGFLFLQANTSQTAQAVIECPISKTTASLFLATFISLLVVLPYLALHWNSAGIALFDAFYRIGSLVFGGGHVVLPLMEAELLKNGMLSDEVFLAGYGAAQAVPGPLFTLAAFLGASNQVGLAGWGGAVCALLAIFLPSFLLVFGVLPFWSELRKQHAVQACLKGANACIVGVLLAALYNPVWLSSVYSTASFCLALVQFSALQFFKVPPWAVVISGALTGYVFW